MKLCEVLRQYIWATHTDLGTLSAELGLSRATLSRVQNGEIPSGTNLSKILCWLLEEEAIPAQPPEAS